MFPKIFQIFVWDYEKNIIENIIEKSIIWGRRLPLKVKEFQAIHGKLTCKIANFQKIFAHLGKKDRTN